jgi:hypothetical protein
MSDSAFVDRVNAISEAFGKSVEFDNKIAEDKLQYSSWLLAIATAGFGLAVTQFKPILDATLLLPMLSEAASRWLLLTATLAFIASATAGAIVKLFINKEIESCRQRLTVILLQKIFVESGACQASLGSDIFALIRTVTDCGLLPNDKQKQYESFTKNGARASIIYERALVVQQSVAGIGYLIVFAVALL